MKALRDRDKNLQQSAAETIWSSYVNENHGNEQQISLELAQNPDLIKGLKEEWDKKSLIETFTRKIVQMNSHTELMSKSRWEKTAESVLEDGTFDFPEKN